MREILSVDQFNYLYDAVIAEYESKSGLTNKPKVTVIFGQTASEDEPSLKTILLKDSATRKLLESIKPYNQKILYIKKLDLENQKNKSSVELGSIYLKLYLEFIGKRSKEELFSEVPENKEISGFTGWFYSVRLREIKEFKVKISKENDLYEVTQSGIHERWKEQPFGGKLVFESQSVTLQGELTHQSGPKIFMILKLTNPKVLENAIIPGIGLTIATHNFPFTFQFVLIKDELSDAENKKYLTQYLNLRRNNFRISPGTYDQIINLKIQEQKADIFKYMIGTYRIWHFDQYDKIIQTKLSIDSSYKAVYWDSPDEEALPYNCQLSVTTYGKIRLCMSFHENDGEANRLLGFAFIDLLDRASPPFTSGVVSLVTVEKLMTYQISLHLESKDSQYDQFLPGEISDNQFVEGKDAKLFNVMLQKIKFLHDWKNPPGRFG